MPHNLTPAASWGANATAPADGDAGSQATFDPPFQEVYNRLELLKARALGGVTVWPRTGLVKTISINSGIIDQISSSIAWAMVNGNEWVSTTSGNQRLCFPLNNLLRTGELLTGASCIFKPANASSGMRFGIYYVPHSWGAPTSEPVSPVLLGDIGDDGTNNKQLRTVTGLSHTVDLAANDYFARVTSGNTTPGADRFYAARYVYTDPGVT